MSSLTIDHDTLVVQTPYNPGLVASIKSLPITDRKWDNNRKVWLVAPQHAARIASWIFQYCNEMVMLPQYKPGLNSFPVLKMLEVHYLGSCKMRDDGSSSAFGYIDGQWGVIIPEDVLREWFDKSPQPRAGEGETLYQVLGIAASADPDAVKPAYYRMAKLWHPDICQEPDAAARFKRIYGAYELLSDPIKRAKYDAGLALERMTFQASPHITIAVQNYRAPLLCGLIMAEGTHVLDRFVVKKIYEWQDIVNNRGQTLVTSWPMGAKSPVENWV